MAKLLHVIFLLASLAAASASSYTTIYEAISAQPNLSILKTALDVTGVAVLLKDKSFTGTVFAPTNAAMVDLLRKFGLSQKQVLSDPALVYVLQYHALPVTLLAKDIPLFPARVSPKTIDGQRLTLYKSSKAAFVFSYNSAARIVKADITTAKAALHVIDSVMIPFGTTDYTGCQSVADRVAGLGPNFSTLVAAVKKAGLLTALKDKKFTGTIFAPTNKAFALAMKATGQTLQTISASDLKGLLYYHASPKPLSSRYFRNNLVVSTLAEQPLSLIVDKSGKKVQSFGSTAQILTLDYFTCRAVIHVVDQVLIPKF